MKKKFFQFVNRKLNFHHFFRIDSISKSKIISISFFSQFFNFLPVNNIHQKHNFNRKLHFYSYPITRYKKGQYFLVLHSNFFDIFFSSPLYFCAEKESFFAIFLLEGNLVFIGKLPPQILNEPWEIFAR